MPASPPLRRLLVTGGCGFIGSAFVRYASRAGHRIVVLDAFTYAADRNSVAECDNVPIVEGNIGDAQLVSSLLREHAVDSIVNFAAETHVDRSIAGPMAFVESNIEAVATLLGVATEYRRSLDEEGSSAFRFVQISTDEVFGSLGATGTFDEESRYDPRSPYSASKAAADHLVSAWHHTYGLPTITTYCTNNFGPFQYAEKLIPLLVSRACAGLPLPIYGDGSNVRDWIHVDDHVRGVLLALNHGVPGRTYAFGGGNERSNLMVATAVCSILDEVAPRADGTSHAAHITLTADRLGHDFRYAIDGQRAASELGFVPEHEFDAALRSTVLWYVDRLSGTPGAVAKR